jgi:hypothetical protein
VLQDAGWGVTKREPGKGFGGFGTASTFGSLDGWSFADVDEFLSEHPELKRKSETKNGYQYYEFKDRSEVWIRPDGQLIRIPFPMYDSDGQAIKGLRFVVSGEVMRSGAWHLLPRDEHEWVVIDDSTN